MPNNNAFAIRGDEVKIHINCKYYDYLDIFEIVLT